MEVDVYCPDSVVGIQVNPKAATKEYIEFLLRFWRPVFLAQAPETARANINLDTLRPLRIPVPPVPPTTEVRRLGRASRASAYGAAGGVASGQTPVHLAPRPRLQRLNWGETGGTPASMDG
jgi:hypothetical protein